jgi:para-aminobenzoate synthetase / 4-amino-4-deoxychorismate lyase
VTTSGVADPQGTVEVRFDDCGPGGEGFRLSGLIEEIVAVVPGDVPGALERAHAEARRGRWVGGYVAYDAAVGLAPEFRVPGRPEPGDGGPPLVWFGVFERAEPVPGMAPVATPAWAGPVAMPDRDRYRNNVEAIHEAIAAGDVYQVNLTEQLSFGPVGSVQDLYLRLARGQRARYNSLVVAQRRAIVSASPELFFEVDNDRIVTRPMKGTAPRSRSAQDDLDVAARLAASDKDRAENIMIVDLVRNDLGRVAITGSVTVEDLLTVERYPTVFQMTSTVSARLPRGWSLLEVFAALFPCGSVTGAPKIAAMAHIARLESKHRGVYCGAIGYLAPGGGQARFSVAIRTAVVDLAGGSASYGSGGGITWDATADDELAELAAKVKVLTRPPLPQFELLETMRHEPGCGVALLDAHLDRMGSSAEYFGFPFNRREVRTLIKAATVDAERPVRVRLTLDDSGRALVDTGDAPVAPRRATVVVDDVATDSADVLRAHKTTARAHYEVRAAAHGGFDDVILVNERGELTESTIASLAVRLDGVWYTPPLSSGCLPGVARRVALERGELVERVLDRRDVRRAEDVALFNALRGWWPVVVAIDELVASAGNP